MSSGTPWESTIGYPRAVRMGDHISVAGTTATAENGAVIGKGDVAAQTRYALQKIERALKEAGASLAYVVRTRMFVTHLADWEIIGRVQGEFFDDVRPAASMVEVARLIDPDHLVEIAVDAFLEGR